MGIVNLVHRPRPTVPYVYQVTEHPGASSYPSGHTMFVVTVVVVLMVCFGHRFLPRWGQVAGWTVAVLLVLANAIGRMYTGAHWPSDVLGGVLLAAFWLSLLASVRRVYDLSQARPKAAASGMPPRPMAAAGSPKVT